MEKKPWLVDVPVAVIFFARPETLVHTFNRIKEARPSRLYLIQDGPRANRPDDPENIQKCRDIVADVDWDCDVKTNYSEVNLSCGTRPFTGISWAMEQEDRLIIIEDDAVPDVTFFAYCAELLEHYKDDQRVAMITAANLLGEWMSPKGSYFFGKSGQISCWATWRRCWEKIDSELEFVDDEEAMRLLACTMDSHTYKRDFKGIRKYREQIKSGAKLTYWSTKWNYMKHLQHGLVIIPKRNMVENIGTTANSTFSTKNPKWVPHCQRNIFFAKTHPVEFPLEHPKYMIHDREFDAKVNRLVMPGFWLRQWMRIEGRIRRLIFR